MTDSYNYGNINLGETAGLTRASIIDGGAANGITLGSTDIVNFTGTPAVFGDITLSQNPGTGTLVVINQPGTYFISASVVRDTDGAGPGFLSIFSGDPVSPTTLAIQSTDEDMASNASTMITVTPSDINDLLTSIRNIRIRSSSTGSSYLPDGNTLIVTKV